MKKRGDAKMKRMLWLGLFMFMGSLVHADKNPEKWESWESTEIAHVVNHFVFTSSSIYIDGIVVSSHAQGGAVFAIFDSSTIAKVDNNFVHVTSISLSAGSNFDSGDYIPIKYRFSRQFNADSGRGFGLMINVTGTARWRMLYNWVNDIDRTLGD